VESGSETRRYCVSCTRNDFDIFADLADRLGFEQAYTEGRNELGWLRHIYEVARDRAQKADFDPPDFDTFWRAGLYEFRASDIPLGLLQEFRVDWSEIGWTRLRGRSKSSPKRMARFFACAPISLHLLSNQAATRLHSQLDPAPASRKGKICDHEPLAIHPDDAKAREISDGDLVRVYNDRGAFLATAMFSDHLRPGVVIVATGVWYDPENGGVPGALEKHGNPNVVTMDKGTSRLSRRGRLRRRCSSKSRNMSALLQ
jgi:biotin/methionine sulfoxide reductase